MADEIVQQLGFDVNQALTALNRLDDALRTSSTSFNTFAAALRGWNATADDALRTMRGLASSATRLATAMQNAGAAPAPVAPAPAPAPAAPAQQLWLPPGVQAQAQQLGNALVGAGRAGQRAGQQVAGAMGRAAQQTSSAKKMADKFVVSFETMSRVVMTQLIVRVMSSVRDALKDATASAIDFQQAIAEIRTIAPAIGGDFRSLSEEAAEFSKAFNVPLEQVTSGLYEIISDQFEKVSDRASIMSASMKLARVAVMDFGDASKLLTGTLNAYGLAASEAENVAAKFFATINLGSVTGKELADTVGQVIPIASQLGITLDELNASIVSMTIGGMDAHKTATGLRAAMTGLLKPSEDMQRVIRSLGFTSAEQLISAKGFQGALLAVADASNDMASEIVKSFRNVRALTTELRLTQTGAEKVEKALKAMGESTPDALNKIYQEFRETDSEALKTSLNELKVTLTQDLGAAIIPLLNWLMQLVGGADELAAGIQGLAAAAVPAAAALGGLAIAFAMTNIAAGPLGLAFMGLTLAMMTFAGSSAYSSARVISDIRKVASERRRIAIDEIKIEEEKLRKIREAELKALTQANKDWENRAASIRRTYFKALDDLKDKNQTIIESDRVLMQSMIASQEKVVTAYRNAATQNLRIIQQSKQREFQTQVKYDDEVFRRKAALELTEERKSLAYLRRSRTLAEEASQALSRATTEDQVEAALTMQQRAEAAAQEAQSIAEGTVFTMLQEDAHRNVLSIYEQKIAAEQRLQQLQAQQAQQNARRAAEEQARVGRMKVAMKAILESLEAFDKQGAKTPQQLARQQAALRQNLAQLQADWLGGQQVDVAGLLAMDKLQQRITTALEGGVDRVEVQQFFARETTFAQLREDIERGIGPIRILIEESTKFSPRLKKQFEGMTAEEAVTAISQELQESANILKDFRQMQDSLKIANLGFRKAQDNARSGLSEWAREFADIEAARFDDPLIKLNFREKYDKAQAAVRNFTELARRFTLPGADITEQDYTALNKAYKDYLSVMTPSKESQAKLTTIMSEAAAAADAAKKAMELEGGIKALRVQAHEASLLIPDIQSALEAAEEAAKQTKGATDQAALSAGAAADGLANVADTDMSGLVSQINQAAAAMRSLANASAGVQTPLYSAAGGLARGIDTVPAMLSPGEFVINARSARRFYSQLQAINSGSQPVYRESGGSVTNIGDVSITVQDSGNPQQTARAVMQAIRREQRRGSAR